jgi:hypothetical protein
MCEIGYVFIAFAFLELCFDQDIALSQPSLAFTASANAFAADHRFQFHGFLSRLHLTLAEKDDFHHWTSEKKLLIYPFHCCLCDGGLESLWFDGEIILRAADL